MKFFGTCQAARTDYKIDCKVRYYSKSNASWFDNETSVGSANGKLHYFVSYNDNYFVWTPDLDTAIDIIQCHAWEKSGKMKRATIWPPPDSRSVLQQVYDEMMDNGLAKVGY